MKVIQTVSLALIAIVMTAQLWIGHIRPFLFVSEHEAEYLELSVQCELAKIGVGELNEQSQDLSQQEIQKIAGAIRVSLVACHKREKLRHVLLSNGVKYSILTTIELESREDDRIPIFALVDRYAPEL